MAIVMAHTKYTLLTKLGIDSSGLEKAGVKMLLGFYDVKFVDNGGTVMWEYKLPVSTNDIMKGVVPAGQLEVVKGAIATGVDLVTVSSSFMDPVALPPESKPVPPLDVGVTKFKFDQFIATPDDLPPEKVVKLERVHLKDATRLYQPVYGSSSESRYFVIAIGKEIKIAARVLDDNVSIRAEGTLTPATSKALESVGILPKESHYASGHFKLHGKVSAERLIGAVLLGSGLEFQTPIPSVKFFKSLGV